LAKVAQDRIERTLVLIKPDGVARNLTGTIISRIEARGLRVVAMQMQTLSAEVARTHYQEHQGKPFFESLVAFITSGPVVALVVEGSNAIAALRQLAGATDPLAAATGSIRGDFAVSVGENIIHASDSEDSAKREVRLFFPSV
jgi:nucleoside-diphosphate kinase